MVNANTTEGKVEVRLAALDGETLTVDKDVIALSGVISNMIADLKGELDTEESIPLPSISSDVLLKIIKWCEHYSKDGPPEVIEDDSLESKIYDIEISDWDKDFFNTKLSQIFDLISAANFLEIKSLLHQACKIVADDYIKGKSIVEVRRLLGIGPDLTDEELEEIRKENAWRGED